MESRAGRDLPPVLTYETPKRLAPPGPPAAGPRERRPKMEWLVARRLAFAVGLGLLAAGLVDGFAEHERSEAMALAGWGAAFVGLCIPLGRLPWFMHEDGPA